MAIYYGSLEAVDCHIHSVRYDMVLESSYGSRHRSQMASSGHLRRSFDADTTIKFFSCDNDASLLPWPTIMNHSKLSLVPFTVHSEVRYGAEVTLAAISNWASSGHLRVYNMAITTTKFTSSECFPFILSCPYLMGRW